jgi:hypothetical protein
LFLNIKKEPLPGDARQEAEFLKKNAEVPAG